MTRVAWESPYVKKVPADHLHLVPVALRHFPSERHMIARRGMQSLGILLVPCCVTSKCTKESMGLIEDESGVYYAKLFDYGQKVCLSPSIKSSTTDDMDNSISGLHCSTRLLWYKSYI